MTRLNRMTSQLLDRSGFGAFLRKTRTVRGLVSLCYHRIGDGVDSAYDHAVWSATPEMFDVQVRLLKKNFDVVGPGDLHDVRRKRGGKYVLISFDDGYRDNYIEAFPVLKAHNVTATFFIATGFLDRPHLSWWDEIAWMVRKSPRSSLPPNRGLCYPLVFDEPDREGAVCTLLALYKTLPGDATDSFLEYLAEATGSGRCIATDIAETWMTWDMVKQMRAAGMSIGGHTVNHPILSRLSRDQQLKEIMGCKQRIESELGEKMRWLSYPRGKPDSFNEDTRRCLRDAEVEMAFSYYGGFRRFEEWDAYDVPRTAVEMDTTREEFLAMVTLPQVFA